MLSGKEPGPGESGPWGGQGGEGALAGCGGRAVMVPGSCLIIPFSIWALRVLGGESECFLFLEGCVGSLGRQRCAVGAGSPQPRLCALPLQSPVPAVLAGGHSPEDASCRRPWGVASSALPPLSVWSFSLSLFPTARPWHPGGQEPHLTGLCVSRRPSKGPAHASGDSFPAASFLTVGAP